MAIRKLFVHLMALSAVLFVLAIPGYCESFTFSEDYTDNKEHNNWIFCNYNPDDGTVAQMQWSISGNRIQNPGRGTEMIRLLNDINSNTWVDYTYQGTINPIEGGEISAGLIFRAQDFDNFYLLSIKGDSNSNATYMELSKRVNGQDFSLGTREVASATSCNSIYVPNSMRTYTCKVIVNGDRITVSIRAEMAVDWETQVFHYESGDIVVYDNTYSRGKIGIGTVDTRLTDAAAFDNLSVSGTSDPSSANLPMLRNIALGKTATQSSIYTGSSNGGGAEDAKRAVDGNIDGNHGNRSVTHTNFENSPWWSVDLGAEYNIGKVLIYNRTDACMDRLKNYTLEVKDSANNVTYAYVADANYYPDTFDSIDLYGVVGRYVKIKLNTTQYLSLAEVKVLKTNSPTTIPERAFYNNKNLCTIKLPSSVKSIGKEAFRGCSRLMDLKLDSIVTVGSNALDDCSSLRDFASYDGIATSDERTYDGDSAKASNAIDNNVNSAWASYIPTIEHYSFLKVDLPGEIGLPRNAWRIRSKSDSGTYTNQVFTISCGSNSAGWAKEIVNVGGNTDGDIMGPINCSGADYFIVKITRAEGNNAGIYQFSLY